MMLINHLVSKMEKIQFIIAIILGEACTSTKRPALLYYFLKKKNNNYSKVRKINRTEDRLMRYTDQYVPGV